MWLFTPHGFFSVVVDPSSKQKRLIVRGRRRKDLTRLAADMPGPIPEVLVHAGTDYEFRFFVTREHFAQWMNRWILEGLGYTNFKNTVAEADPERAHLYSEVWWTMARGLGASPVDRTADTIGPGLAKAHPRGDAHE